MDETQEVIDYLDSLIEKANEALSSQMTLNRVWWEGYKVAAEKSKEFVEEWMLN